MSDVPPGVLVDILSRLPVKSLLRFRSVSKSICSLIDSRYFINLHLNQSMKKTKVLTFVKGSTPSNSFHLLHLDSGAMPVKLEPPFDIVDFFPKFLGSCNGLICLSRGVTNREILLWNPSTRKYKVIKAIKVHYSHGFGDTYTIDRLGYDDVTDDYKIVRLSQSRVLDSKSVVSIIIVYSLKLNIWQLVEQDFPYYVCQHGGHGMYCSGPVSHGVFVNGAIHWVVTQKPTPDMNYLIVAFDFNRQRFQLVPQPEYAKKYVAINLGLLGSCLCVVGNHEMYRVDVWVMGKYGVKESWRKLVALTMCDVMMRVLPCVRPILYLKDEKEVVLELDHECILIYDLVKKKSRHRKINGVSYSVTFVSQESLVYDGRHDQAAEA